MISRADASAVDNLYKQSVISRNISGAFRANHRCRILSRKSRGKMSRDPHHFNSPYDAEEEADEIDDEITPICIWDIEVYQVYRKYIQHIASI